MWWLVLPLVLALLGPGCGSESSRSSDGGSATTEPVLLSEAQLHDALLTPDDLSEGWQAAPVEDPWTELEDMVFDQTCEGGHAAVKEETHDAEAVKLQSVAFGTVLQGLVAAEDATEHLADLEAAFDSCVGDLETDTSEQGFVGEGSIVEVSVPDDLGDDAVGYQFTSEGTMGGEPFAMEIDDVFVRNGLTLEVYEFGNLAPSETPGELPDELVAVIEAGDAKVTDVTTSPPSAEEPADETTTTTAAPSPRSPLDDVLLTLDDLPDGWVVSARAGTDELGTLGPGADFLCPSGEPSVKDEEHGGAGVSFMQPDAPTATILVEVLTSAPDAEEHMADIRSTFDSCLGQTWTSQIAGDEVEVALTATSPETVGDETFGYRMDLEATEGPNELTFDWVFVRNGDVVELWCATLSSELDASLFTDLVRAGDAKVTEAAAAGAGTETTAGPPLAKDDFVAQANSICAATHEELRNLDMPPFPAEGDVVALQEYLATLSAKEVPLLRAMLDELRLLEPPAEDRARIEAAWDDFDSLVDSFETTPSNLMIVLFPEDPELYGYGLTECFVEELSLL